MWRKADCTSERESENIYFLKYTTSSDNTDFTLSENGYIVASSSINENSAITVYVELYKEGSSKRIERKYIIVSLRIGEYANITLNNDNLVYDSPTSTYTMTMDSGSKYNILYSVSYNTAYTISFSLKDSSYLSFMNVDSSGLITTIQTKENKVEKENLVKNSFNLLIWVMKLRLCPGYNLNEMYLTFGVILGKSFNLF